MLLSDDSLIRNFTHLRGSYHPYYCDLTRSLLAQGAQCFVFYMDIRFVGGWQKKDDMSKFWGWLMA